MIVYIYLKNHFLHLRKQFFVGCVIHDRKYYENICKLLNIRTMKSMRKKLRIFHYIVILNNTKCIIWI